MLELIHQQQPTLNSCVSTCIAMLLNIPAQQVIDDFHDSYMNDTMNADDYLKEHGFDIVPCLSTYRSLLPGKVYLIGIPSLNIVGGTHEVIFDFRDDLIILDPNQGKPNKKYYVWKAGCNLTDLEVDIKSYFFDFEITP